MSELLQLMLVFLGGIVLSLAFVAVNRHGEATRTAWRCLGASYGLMVFSISWGQLDRYLNEEDLTTRTPVFFLAYFAGVVGLVLILRRRKEG